MRARTAITLLLTIAFGIGVMRESGIAQSQAAPRHAPPPAEMRVDINHATLEELLKIPGMTRTWAERVVRFRPYRTKQDLMDRGVVSGEIYNRIKDYIIAHRENSGQ